MLAILALGSEGSASREITVEPSIERIVWRVVVGGVSDVAGKTKASCGNGEIESIAKLAGRVQKLDLQLRIDNQPRTGVIAWGEAAARVGWWLVDDYPPDWFLAAANRVAGYALRRDQNTTRSQGGAVEYSYRLRIRGYDIRRATRIEDGRVSIVTDVYGSIGPRGELHHVRLVLDAQERSGGTIIVGTATGWTEIGERCRLVSSIASRQIRSAMDRKLLARVQSGGIDLYQAGGIAEVLR